MLQAAGLTYSPLRLHGMIVPGPLLVYKPESKGRIFYQELHCPRHDIGEAGDDFDKSNKLRNLLCESAQLIAARGVLTYDSDGWLAKKKTRDCPTLYLGQKSNIKR